MHAFFRRLIQSALIGAVSLVDTVSADSIVPGNILNPKNAAEAWNVIRLATRNVELLLDEQRLKEIPVQISYCGPSLIALPRLVTNAEVVADLESQISRAFVSVNAIAGSAKDGNPVGAKSALAALRSALDRAARHFDSKDVGADIYFCPMHSDFLSESEKTPCAKCGMNLLTRRIPYSFIYTKPGEPSVRITAASSAPIAAGQKIEVKIQMEKSDKSPVLHADLLEMHTQPIHLLVEEPGLGDYHHEHPIPTQTPGEYAFSFTPTKTVPYRVWAEIVPAATGVQELPFVDLPALGKATSIAATANRFTTSVGGYRFALAFADGNHLPTNAGRTRSMGVTITDADDKPVVILEPVMNAFAHLVGFYDDYRTVVHLHPLGGDVLNPDLRGGPTLGFILYPPKAGFIRLYCQVSIGGTMLFAPFNLNVEP